MINNHIIWSVAIVLAGVSWASLHRVALNRGFIVKRHGISTDTAFSLIIGFTSTVWTVAAISNLDAVIGDSSTPLLTRLAHAPLLVQIVFFFWLIIWIDALVAERIFHSSPVIWNLSVISGPFDWMESLTKPVLWAFYILLVTVIVPTSISAILDGYPVQGILNMAGLIIFLVSGSGPNSYPRAPHRYSADMLRIILPTSHHEGTVYILPSSGYGFDAVWSPKVENENIQADQQAMALFASMRSGKWPLKEPLERIRTIVASYQRRLVMSSTELQALARWLYFDGQAVDSKMRSIECDRAQNTHLIGRDLMYALCHAEYMLFMGQGRLPPALQQQLGMLRLMKRSGAAPSPVDSSEPTCVGFRPGFEGYKEAVEYIYKLFDQPIDHSALHFDGTRPPKYSSALSKSLDSIEEYVAELWDVSCTHNESTFTALYMFTVVWSIEMGNCNGFHMFPLRCKNRKGDLVSLQIVWRQAWYSGILCQLLSSSPLLFAAFAAGYLG